MTTPNRKEPSRRNATARRMRSFAVRFTSPGSDIRVDCSRHTPGKIKMKMAAKDPRISMISPMFGI